MKTLLIADDSEKYLEILAEHFSKTYRVLTAADGVDALMLAMDHRPDAIILDISMPFLDGRIICRKLKGYPGTKDIKIVMFSAKDQQHDRRIGFEVGADDYVEKPCQLEFLAQRVARVLGERE